MTKEVLQETLGAETIHVDYDGTISVYLDGWLHLERLEEWMQAQSHDVEFDDLVWRTSLERLVDGAVLCCLPGDRPGVVTGKDERADLIRLASALESAAARLRRVACGESFEPKS